MVVQFVYQEGWTRRVKLPALWLCWRTNPQRKENLSCCSWAWPLSHSCACLGCCPGQAQVSRVYIANLVCKWFSRLSLMPNGCLYWHCKWGEFYWALLPEPRAWRGPASVLDSCCHEGEGSGRGVGLPLLAPVLWPLTVPNFIASQREKHPRNPVTYCVRWSLPLKHLQFVPCAVFVCHRSEEITEKAMYTK